MKVRLRIQNQPEGAGYDCTPEYLKGAGLPSETVQNLNWAEFLNYRRKISEIDHGEPVAELLDELGTPVLIAHPVEDDDPQLGGSSRALHGIQSTEDAKPEWWMDRKEVLIQEILEALPYGFEVDWTQDFSYSDGDGEMQMKYISSLLEAEDWMEDASEGEEDAARAAVEYFQEAENAADEAKSLEEKAEQSLKAGDIETGFRLIREAADNEKQYGDHPEYQTVLDLIEKYELICEAEEEG